MVASRSYWLILNSDARNRWTVCSRDDVCSGLFLTLNCQLYLHIYNEEIATITLYLVFIIFYGGNYLNCTLRQSTNNMFYIWFYSWEFTYFSISFFLNYLLLNEYVWMHIVFDSCLTPQEFMLASGWIIFSLLTLNRQYVLLHACLATMVTSCNKTAGCLIHFRWFISHMKVN